MSGSRPVGPGTGGGGSGTVTSLSAGAGITLTPNPITTTGTISASGAAGALEVLTASITSGSATTVSFTSAFITSSHRDLIITLYGRSQAVANTDTVLLRFNSDAGASSYTYQRLSGINGTPSAASTTQSSVHGGTISAASATANYAGQTTISVLGYSATAFFKPAYAEAVAIVNTGTNNRVEVVGSLWHSTSAITQVDVFLQSGGAFEDGTGITVYGRG